MRKAIRQTEGMIAHLLSAYRGILRHAYLAGLILTLAGGGTDGKPHSLCGDRE